MLPLVDKSARRSKSTEKSHGTERFLQHINHPRAYETLLAEDNVVDGTLLGMFSTYISDTAKIKM